jgi:hypothetical protein
MSTHGHWARFHRAALAAALILILAPAARTQILGGSRIEDTDPSVVFAGSWSVNLNLNHSGGTAKLSTDPGATATVPFTGTGIHWIGYQDQWSGIASIFLDGDFLQTVDTYAPSARYQALLYSIEGLPLGPHRLTVMALGVHDAAAAESWIWVDAFDVVNGTPGTAAGDPWATSTRYEETSPATALTGTWYSNTSSFLSGGSAVLSEEAGARATFSFTGTRVRWIGYRDEYSGIGRVYLDGALVAVYDTYASPAQAQAIMFRTGALGRGPHTLAVEAAHLHLASAREKWVWVDAFDVVP